MAKVMLVEDVPVVRMTLQKFLQRGGHEVTLCGGGEEAWTQIRTSPIDAIVTDLWMIDGDGPELIKRMRSSGITTPIIAITGGDPRSPQSSSLDLALRAGAFCALLKPITKAALLGAIDECLEETRAGAETH